jgi:endonuclease/exonuclease/phosphatase (EEP) superfamily protein YafD
MLVHLNVWNARVRDFPSRPIYGVGERSGIRLPRVIPRIAWLLVAVHVAWVVVRLFGLEAGYPLMPLLAYTPYVAVTALAVALVAGLLRVRAAAVTAALACLVLVVLVVPRALGGPTEPEGGSGVPLRVMTFNLHRGEADAEAIVALAARERVDVLSLQEVDAAALERLEAAGLRSALRSRVAALGAGMHGTALYARAPLIPLDPLRNSLNEQARARVGLRGAQAVEVMAVHPLAPASVDRARRWGSDMRGLPPATPHGALQILAGDFNATLDHAELRRLINTGYVDAADVVGDGLRPTWPVGRRLPPVTIDHVLVDRRCGVRRVAVHTLPGSDHRAVIAELVIPR